MLLVEVHKKSQVVCIIRSVEKNGPIRRDRIAPDDLARVRCVVSMADCAARHETEATSGVALQRQNRIHLERRSTRGKETDADHKLT